MVRSSVLHVHLQRVSPPTRYHRYPRGSCLPRRSGFLSLELSLDVPFLDQRLLSPSRSSPFVEVVSFGVYRSRELCIPSFSDPTRSVSDQSPLDTPDSNLYPSLPGIPNQMVCLPPLRRRRSPRSSLAISSSAYTSLNVKHF